jgi:hypothetical protein
MRLPNPFRPYYSKPATQYIHVLLIAGFAILLLWPAWYNGYPLVYSDSGTYINSGFELQVPQDRPIVYGLFIRFTSFRTSLWWVIVAQALISSILIYQLISTWVSEYQQRLITFVIAALILLTCSGLPWYCSTILTEVFTPWSVILLTILLCKPTTRSYKIVLASLIVLINLTHLANLSAALVLSVLLLLISGIPKQVWIKPKQSLWIFALSILSFATLSILNKSLGGGWQLSQSSHIFLTGKMIENGILKTYLDAECDHQQLNMCAYKDSLPEHASDFLWQASSPLYALGGFDSNATEYKTILNDIFTTQPYLGMFIQESAKATALQLTLNGYGEEFIPYPLPSDPPYGQVSWRFNSELPQYLSAKQHTTGIDLQQLKTRSQFQLLLVGLSICIMVWMIAKQHIPDGLASAWIIFSSFYVSNATQAAINTFCSRHNTKLSWLFILFAIIALSIYTIQLRKSRLSQKSKTK